MAVSTFFHFPLLPAEIRIQVWCLLLTPRVLYPDFLNVQVGGTPILLRVSQESRSIALQQYKLVRNRYVNFLDDIIYIAYVCVFDLHGTIRLSPNESEIRFLAIDVELFLQAAVQVMETIVQCPKLLEVQIIVKSERPKSHKVPLTEAAKTMDGEKDKALNDMLQDIWLLGRRGKNWPKISICTVPYANASMAYPLIERDILA